MAGKDSESGKDSEPLLAPGIYEYNNRPPRDRVWGWAYALFLALTVVGGVYGVTHRSPMWHKAVEPGYLDDATHCPVHDTGARRLLLEEYGSQEFDLGEFFHTAGWWMLVSAALAVVVGIVFLRLLQHHASKMIWVAIGVQVLIPLAAGGALAATHGLGAGATFLVIGSIAAVCIFVWRDFFPLAARLLSVAAEGLNSNSGLIGFVLLVQLALLLLLLPVFVLMAVAWTNGQVAPNPMRRDLLTGGELDSHSVCRDAQGEEVPCCVWEVHGWVGPWMALASLTVLWSTFLAFTIRLFVISGTIAQWYFAAASLTSTTRGAMRRCIRHALGSSFGSLCCGSAILTWVEVMRSAANSARSNNDNLLACLMRALLECIYQLIEYITKFAVVRLAITGEAFFDAGRNAADLLSRNFLKSVGVWWFPPLVLNATAFAASVAWGGAVYGLSKAAWAGRVQGNLDAILLGVFSGLLAALVLSFLVSVLLDCVNAIYFAYAMDRDMDRQTRADAHMVFAALPVVHTQGAPIVNPDGGLAYGRYVAEQQPAGGPYGAPVYGVPVGGEQQQPYGAPVVQRAPYPGSIV